MHVEVPCDRFIVRSQGLEILTLIREKKKNLYSLFYIKCFRWFRFNPLKLIWIKSLKDLKFKSDLEY
jgi:hypothetical protein